MQHVLTSVAPLQMMGGLVKFGGEIQLTTSRVHTSDGAAFVCKLYTSPDFEIPLDSTYLVCTLVRETEKEEGFFESTLVRRTAYNARTHDVAHLIELPDDDDRLRVYVELKVQGIPESMVRGPRLSFCV